MRLRQEIEVIDPRQANDGLELTLMPTMQESQDELISGEHAFRQAYPALAHVVDTAMAVFETAYPKLDQNDIQKMVTGTLLGFMAVTKAAELDTESDATSELRKLDVRHMGAVFVRVVAETVGATSAQNKQSEDQLWNMAPALGMINDNSYDPVAKRFRSYSDRQKKYVRAGILWAVRILHEENLMQTEVRDDLTPRIPVPATSPSDETLPGPGPLRALRRRAK